MSSLCPLLSDVHRTEGQSLYSLSGVRLGSDAAQPVPPLDIAKGHGRQLHRNNIASGQQLSFEIVPTEAIEEKGTT